MTNEITNTNNSNLPQESNAPENTPESAAQIGRNEPCPCGSGKKYKRCHGVSAAPKLTAPKMNPGEMPAMPPGMENMDPQMMMQAAQMLQRLPRGQLQRLQSIMQRAMAGKDVTREAEEFQKTLPPDFQQMMASFAAMSGAMGGQIAPESVAPVSETSGSTMSEEEARAIVARAAEQGKLSEEKAQELLTGEGEKSKGIGKFWKNLTGKQTDTQK